MKNRRITKLLALVLALFFGVMLAQTAANAADLKDKQRLGKLIFFDTNLSSPAGQACGSCHVPEFGFSDPDKGQPTSSGILPLRVGPRNAPTITYLATAPDFAETAPGAFVGGQFWDSRAANLFELAKLPFLNPLEMHNPDPFTVVHDVSKADYAPLFKQVFGSDVFSNRNRDQAYNDVADAVSTFLKGPDVNKFNSKFDAFLRGEVQLTAQEAEGLQIFEGKGHCNRCHVTTPNSEGGPPVFTSFKFANVGVPANPNNPFYTLIPSLNRDGSAFIDEGLGGFLKNRGDLPAVYEPQMGKFNFPTLRNIELTSPYFHNGVFDTLKEVVHFVNVRDVPGSGFGPPEVPENVTTAVGNLGLTDAEEDAVVAFLETLTDDFKP